MEILVVQHVLFESPALIEEWARENKYPFHCVLAESVDFHSVGPFDLLILMGGPMSVNDEEQFTWLITEKAFVRNAIEAGKLVLGICLGAQLIANCLGAKVYKNKYKELVTFQYIISTHLHWQKRYSQRHFILYIGMVKRLTYQKGLSCWLVLKHVRIRLFLTITKLSDYNFI
jgi:GMP synthase-like glutamine amidotransferase